MFDNVGVSVGSPQVNEPFSITRGSSKNNFKKIRCLVLNRFKKQFYILSSESWVTESGSNSSEFINLFILLIDTLDYKTLIKCKNKCIFVNK